jgi:hypothetical protein
MTDDDRSVSEVYGLDDDPKRGDPATPLEVERLHGERWHFTALVTDAFSIEDGELRDDLDDAAPRLETGEAIVAIVRLGDPVVGDPAQAQSPINQAIRAAVQKARRFMHRENEDA